MSDDYKGGLQQAMAFMSFLGGDWAEDLFGQFLDIPGPADFNPIITSVRDAMAPISSGHVDASGKPVPSSGILLKMSDVGDAAYIWEGRAADAFNTNFATPFPGIVGNEFLVATALEGALLAEQKIWDNARKDVLELAEKTIAALDEANDTFGAVITGVLTVAAAVVPLAGVATIGAIELITAAASIGAYATSGGFEIDGGNEISVLFGAIEAAEQIKTDITAQETKVQETLTAVAGAVRDNTWTYQLQRPELVTADPGSVPGIFQPGS